LVAAAPSQIGQFTNHAEVTTSTTRVGGNTADATITVVAADLVVTKVADPATLPLGGQVTYTMTVTNSGNIPAGNVRLTDTVPAGLTLVSVAPEPACQGVPTPHCDFGTLPAGETRTMTVVAGTTRIGVFVNVA